MDVFKRRQNGSFSDLNKFTKDIYEKKIFNFNTDQNKSVYSMLLLLKFNVVDSFVYIWLELVQLVVFFNLSWQFEQNVRCELNTIIVVLLELNKTH